MSSLTRTAQLISLIIAVIFYHPASTDLQPRDFSTGIEAIGDEPAGIHVLPETSSESKTDHNSMLRLTTLSPTQTEQTEKSLPTISEPFGLPTMAALPNDVSKKWADLQSRLLTEEKKLAQCRTDESTCPAAAQRLLSIIELSRQKTDRAVLGQINRAVNLAIRPMSDWDQYGVADYWATPLETLISGAGDCEDYAIVKYVALRESGIVPDDLRLVIVRDIKDQTNHAVLAARQDGEWLVLDNRTLIMANTDMANYYYPLFVLDQRGVRTFITAIASR